MIITPRDDLAAIPLDSLGSSNRSPGYHVSGLLRRIMQRLEPGKYDDGHPDTASMALGMAYEDALAHALLLHWGPKIIRPGEIERDGVVGSPDGLDLDEERVSEIKLTRMRYVPDLQHDKYWKWLVQLKAYCHMLGWTKGRLWVMFIGGRDDRGPLPKVWDLEWSVQELEDNWRMLLREKGNGIS